MMVVPSDEHETAASAPAGETAGPSPVAVPTSASGSVDEYIGSRLRQAFDAVAQQPVPDRFLQLIAALDKA